MKTLRMNRNLALFLQVIIGLIAAAVLTPPDVISQVSLALPLIALYEIAIIVGRRIEKARAAAEAE